MTVEFVLWMVLRDRFFVCVEFVTVRDNINLFYLISEKCLNYKRVLHLNLVTNGAYYLPIVKNKAPICFSIKCMDLVRYSVNIHSGMYM